MKLILLILISIITCSCDKEDLVAPPITQENTFSCKIDGKLFVAQPHGGFLQMEGITVQSMQNSWLVILSNGHQVVYIKLKNVNIPGIRDIQRSENIRNPTEANNSVEFIANGGSITTHVSHDDTGFINVLEWKNDSILIFEFDELILYDEENPSKTKTLTDGKLNINLATLEY